MSKAPRVVFLFDVDNTLIDNDRVQADLSKHLEQTYGAATRDRYWEIFEQLRNELGYADYLGALERYRALAGVRQPRPHLHLQGRGDRRRRASLPGRSL